MTTRCDPKNNTTIYMSIVCKKNKKNCTVFFTVQRDGKESFWRGKERGAFNFTINIKKNYNYY